MDKPLTDEQLTDLATQALVAMALDDYRRDLRAGVEALRDEAGRNEFASLEANYEVAAYEYRAQREVLDRVLALIDGRTDDT